MKIKIALFLLLSFTCEAKILDIPRTKQGTNNWCWLASSEMVNKYHGVCSIDKDPDMQCSIIRYMSYSEMVPSKCVLNCKSCDYPAYRLSNLKISLDNYSKDSSRTCGNSTISTMSYRPSSLKRLKKEIDMNRPVMIGINPSLTGKKIEAEHLAVAIGYTDIDGITFVRVNDPYDMKNVSKDPYILVGSKKVTEGVYDVPYNKLIVDFAWQSTVYVRKK